MEAVRLDKGRRILAGMRAAGPTDYFVFFDDDDYASRRLTGYVRANSGANGWYIEHGYGVNHHGRIRIALHPFHKTCGSSHIIRSDLFDVPPEGDPAHDPYVRLFLGAHGAIPENYAKRGHPLLSLPFPGAVYRLDHPNSHSRTTTLFRQYIFNRENVTRRPDKLLRTLGRLRPVDAAFRREFYG